MPAPVNGIFGVCVLQVSELIRVAADDRQGNEQHRLLLHQLHHLCRLIQQPHLQKPEEQMAAVLAHIKQVTHPAAQHLPISEAACAPALGTITGFHKIHPML
jgi:hypothetical protein